MSYLDEPLYVLTVGDLIRTSEGYGEGPLTEQMVRENEHRIRKDLNLALSEDAADALTGMVSFIRDVDNRPV